MKKSSSSGLSSTSTKFTAQPAKRGPRTLKTAGVGFDMPLGPKEKPCSSFTILADQGPSEEFRTPVISKSSSKGVGLDGRFALEELSNSVIKSRKKDLKKVKVDIVEDSSIENENPAAKLNLCSTIKEAEDYPEKEEMHLPPSEDMLDYFNSEPPEQTTFASADDFAFNLENDYFGTASIKYNNQESEAPFFEGVIMPAAGNQN